MEHMKTESNVHEQEPRSLVTKRISLLIQTLALTFQAGDSRARMHYDREFELVQTQELNHYTYIYTTVQVVLSLCNYNSGLNNLLRAKA